MERQLQAASILAHLLDNQFHIGSFRFGFSSFIDLIPGVGDSIDAALSLYIVWIAVKMKVPISIVMRMIVNIVINFLIGLIPVFGDAVYFIRKVNIKNLQLLQRHVPSSFVDGEVVG